MKKKTQDSYLLQMLVTQKWAVLCVKIQSSMLNGSFGGLIFIVKKKKTQFLKRNIITT